MINTDPYEDPQKRVIDFDKLRQKRKRKHASHKRVITIVIAGAVALAALAIAVIWTQAREVTGERDFWHNFNAEAAVIVQQA